MDILLSFSVGDVEPLALEKHECLGAKSPLHNIENKDQLAWECGFANDRGLLD
ncbi:hypothetical protein [Agrobacterium cavarae]|uniref:hypothetical protein n=1 Tax=Agrobacterium cavarae TaxID=2528239 RepID=UPI00289ABBF0|nr:hypothetical protein [Agrobacterium cavarae]